MRSLAVTLLAALAMACQRQQEITIDPAQLAVFAPLPASVPSEANPATPAKVELGWRLYYETQLSSNGSQSCNSCHMLDAYGAESEPVSTGVTGEQGGRNAPTVYNAAGHIAQFWDGRAPDVEEQAKGPILNPIEMGMSSPEAVLARLMKIPGYREAFTAAFPDDPKPLTYDNVGRAIGAFERQLLTPSRWDKYLQGDQTALTTAEKQGLKAFLETGCHGCHNGPFMGGRMFQRLGVVQPWPDARDPGRFRVTQAPADSMVFKVPSLRNIAKTAPYFNAGNVASLDESVRLMARHQLGRELSPEQITPILTFLQTLTGDVPAQYVVPPPPFAGAGSGS
ncbi:MAG: cytochrome-c peroxidase [Gemmatimonadota bacterium]|nr:cytochrome-c peroxidase [Gemmatimonadota bacterium]MDH5284831.1 cytochrome-c peroxidase [Gemmatimonadota bacterium]